jgi:crotonobetainyl-CoA:carnitine CoA-transferase CaiB-like acyl-CoA transferase
VTYPGTAPRCGLQPPHVFLCALSHYRVVRAGCPYQAPESGPYHKAKAYDLLVQVEAGLCTVSGEPGLPVRIGVSLCDIACGMYRWCDPGGFIVAFPGQEREGSRIETKLFAAAAEWTAVPLAHYRWLHVCACNGTRFLTCLYY